MQTQGGVIRRQYDGSPKNQEVRAMWLFFAVSYHLQTISVIPIDFNDIKKKTDASSSSGRPQVAAWFLILG